MPHAARITQRIRSLHRQPERALGSAVGELVEEIQQLQGRGALSQEQATQLIYDVRNERGRIMR
ncbi:MULTISPECIES: hypothetical protein [unclassified Pseudomonas]|uniref:hypothetical protein n=1 Tax=unclassified Pseudomonas TaxID=196821 RepID=UPI000BC9E474|nr:MULTISPECIES: hypothetical protein [unclassified Pseudomonas]PVZ08819.1 hypothetical protein F474_04446 [Pseudomonas sp. URIL14HWK12:I12]PVZ21241.1 hypothetical protein F470_04447 [Pseudomonas sp. URIL14HWK12:I10]PVZ30103.1 hypothetical protein F472_04449 [Pseudomonas sp. URIL14HWK12:I11]SNZ18838.1 hypothetical protein SAMN05660463_04425 [Pseudomonas sp. URIL14HWK12:I9]